MPINSLLRRTLQIVCASASCIVLASVFLQSGRADDFPRIIFTGDRSSNVIQVKGLIEGLTASTEVLLENGTGRSYDHLIAVASCGCLKIRDIDGKRWDAGSTLKATLVYVPTANRFEQSIKLSGAVDDLDREEISTFSIKGKVEPPIQLSKYAILPRDLGNGNFKINLIANPLIEVDFAGIRLGENFKSIKMVAEEETSTVELTFLHSDATKKSMVLHLQIPYRWKGNGYTYTVPIKFEPEPFEVIPRTIVFRSTIAADQQNTVVRGKVLVRGRVSKIEPEMVKVTIRNAQGDTLLDKSAVEIRSISDYSILIEFKLLKEMVSSDSDSLAILLEDSQEITVDFTTNF